MTTATHIDGSVTTLNTINGFTLNVSMNNPVLDSLGTISSIEILFRQYDLDECQSEVTHRLNKGMLEDLLKPEAKKKAVRDVWGKVNTLWSKGPSLNQELRDELLMVLKDNVNDPVTNAEFISEVLKKGLREIDRSVRDVMNNNIFNKQQMFGYLNYLDNEFLVSAIPALHTLLQNHVTQGDRKEAIETLVKVIRANVLEINGVHVIKF